MRGLGRFHLSTGASSRGMKAWLLLTLAATSALGNFQSDHSHQTATAALGNDQTDSSHQTATAALGNDQSDRSEQKSLTNVCTQNANNLCTTTYSFENSDRDTSLGVITRLLQTDRLDASAAVPGRIYTVHDGLLDQVLKWLDWLEGQDALSTLGWSEPALSFMDEALRDDPFSAFEVYVPDSSSSLPHDINTFLINAPGFISKAKDLNSRQPVMKPISDDDRTITDEPAHDSVHDRRRVTIFPSGNPYGPNDDRREILYPNNILWSMATVVSTGNRASRWCSGTMISPTVLLTAAHCVLTMGSFNNTGSFNQSNGLNWLIQPQICLRDVQRSTPTPNQPTVMDCESNEGILGNWSRMTTFVKWARDADRDWDIAWITLSAPLGYISGWRSIKTAERPAGATINIMGYGGDCPPGGDCSDNLKQTSCKVEPHPICVPESSQPNRYYHKCDTTGGTSGASLYRFDSGLDAPDNRWIFAVQTHGSDCSGLSRAIRIRPPVLEAMCANIEDILCYSDSDESGFFKSTCY